MALTLAAPAANASIADAYATRAPARRTTSSRTSSSSRTSARAARFAPHPLLALRSRARPRRVPRAAVRSPPQPPPPPRRARAPARSRPRTAAESASRTVRSRCAMHEALAGDGAGNAAESDIAALLGPPTRPPRHDAPPQRAGRARWRATCRRRARDGVRAAAPRRVARGRRARRRGAEDVSGAAGSADGDTNASVLRRAIRGRRPSAGLRPPRRASSRWPSRRSPDSGVGASAQVERRACAEPPRRQLRARPWPLPEGERRGRHRLQEQRPKRTAAYDVRAPRRRRGRDRRRRPPTSSRRAIAARRAARGRRRRRRRHTR